MKNSFTIVNCDTDSISITKQDQTNINEENREKIVNEINSLLPDKIQMANDGYYPLMLIVKAKNYVLKREDGSLKIKGSGLKATNKPPIVKEYLNKFISLLVNEAPIEQLVELYNSTIKSIFFIDDISIWAKKFTVTEAVMEAERTAQQKVKDAIDTDNDSEKVSEGDKVYLYATKDKKLSRVDKWNKLEPDHDTCSFIKYIYDTTKIFENLIDISKFEKYHLKGKKRILDKLVES